MNFAQLDELIKEAVDKANAPIQDTPELNVLRDRLEKGLEKSAEEIDRASALSVAKFLVAIDLIA